MLKFSELRKRFNSNSSHFRRVPLDLKQLTTSFFNNRMMRYRFRSYQNWAKLLLLVLLLQFIVATPSFADGAKPKAASSTSVITTIGVGAGPAVVAVNPNTNRIYVTDNLDNHISVIDGATNTLLTTLSVGGVVAVNPVTNRIYAANYDTNQVAVIDGTTNQVITTISQGLGQFSSTIAVNPTTNRIYVGNTLSNTVSVIDGNTNTVIDTVNVERRPFKIEVDTTLNRVFVLCDEAVSVINGTNDTTLATFNQGGLDLAVDAAHQRVYIAYSASLQILDENSFTIVASINIANIGNYFAGLGFDPTLNRIYMLDYVDGIIAVIDTATNQLIDTVTLTKGLQDVGVNPTNNRIYVSNFLENIVTVLGSGSATSISCTEPSISQLSEYRLLDNSIGSSDSKNNLANLVDGLDWTFWRWTDYTKAVAIQANLGSPKTVLGVKLFTLVSNKAPDVYFQYSQDGTQWSDIPNLSSVNADSRYGLTAYPVNNITAQYFRIVLDNTTYLYDLGYFSDLQFCTSSITNQPTPLKTPVAHRLPIANTTANGGQPNKLLDGFPWTDWLVAGDPASAALTLDLGQSRTITALKYYTTSTAVARSTKIEISDDPNFAATANIHTIANNLNMGSYGNNGPSYGLNAIPSFNPANGRYIRFTITNTNGDWSLGGFGDLQVFGY